MGLSVPRKPAHKLNALLSIYFVYVWQVALNYQGHVIEKDSRDYLLSSYPSQLGGKMDHLNTVLISVTEIIYLLYFKNLGDEVRKHQSLLRRNFNIHCSIFKEAMFSQSCSSMEIPNCKQIPTSMSKYCENLGYFHR